MERRIRYEVVPDEEEDLPAQPVNMVMVAEAAPEETTTQSTENNSTENAEGVKIPEPPPYDIATDLPTYEEAERTKAEEANQQPSTDEEAQLIQECNAKADVHLGTDGMFICTFVVAFLFNWIGLMAALCMTHTIAARFGALAGFGLSLVKWVAIVKHNNWATGVAEGDSWLWWMLIILGFLIFFRGCLQYIRIKYQWNRLGQNFRERIFMYY